MLDTTLRYTMVTRDYEKTVAMKAADPMVQRESEYYLETIRDIKTIDEFLANDRIFNYAMEAMGLGDMTWAKGMMREALEGGVSEDDSFANMMTDERYADFVTAFNFEAYGETATSFDRAQQEIVDAYIQQSIETTEGEQNNGVRLALYFERKAPEINSAYDILADPALYEVVSIAIGMPDSLRGSDVDRQADYINERLDIASLKDPEVLEDFILKFTNLYDVTYNVTAAPTLQLFAGSGNGVSPDLLLQVNSLKLGG
ncbi:DUF1217 domain-containing protein [Rhodobacteraceae bacterium RKSG542]|uniref:DUF1217 domain-containing protein n=1 Tax=Pseudovibrio flavus TaxID=2529854 RepID=UPI0012BC725E|nr:DUF1217 domain-containing protein [Pseudovibrio flavus]MTI16942.1 DUF1217 domain-containing protein [Pseudovibrio flavus]